MLGFNMKFFMFLKKINAFIKKHLISVQDYTMKTLHALFQGKELAVFDFFKKRKVLVLSLLGSLVISISLLHLMATLIAQKKNLENLNIQNISVDFLNYKDLEDFKTKDRSRPEPPQKAKIPPKTPPLKKQKMVSLDKPKLSMPQPQLDVPKDFSLKGDGVAGGGSQSFYGDSDVTPIVRMEPQYPRKAAMTETEGFVVLSFDITPLGTVTNISILQASPPQIFNTSAVQALQKWKYKPKIVNNKPALQKGLKVRLEFKLDKRNE